MPIGQRVRAVHLSQYCPGGLGYPAGAPGPEPAEVTARPPAGEGAPPPRAGGQPCARCGQLVRGGQPARRRGNGGWTHEDCPPGAMTA